MRPNRPKVSVDQAPKPNRIFDSVWPHADRNTCLLIRKFGALVSGIRQFFSRKLVKLRPCFRPPRIIRSLTRPNWSFHSTRLTMNFLHRQVDGHHQCMHGQDVLVMGSPATEDLAEGVSQTCKVWQRTLPWNTDGDWDRDFLLLEQRRWAIVWMIVFLFAEPNFVCQPKFRYNFRPGPSWTESNIRFAEPLYWPRSKNLLAGHWGSEGKPSEEMVRKTLKGNISERVLPAARKSDEKSEERMASVVRRGRMSEQMRQRERERVGGEAFISSSARGFWHGQYASRDDSISKLTFQNGDCWIVR